MNTRATKVIWERPILHAEIELPQLGTLHVLNLHLKIPIGPPTYPVKRRVFSWKSSAGWAEGYFLSSIKRVGQALETRLPYRCDFLTRIPRPRS